ncbi:MaoC/PaaZ C-terminal domain-containing protein [Actinomadura atramentaria]|uniref:MaoC/PaaZ C-terminal domain-containing protein n=1 Tax=Actinomadura atramentaria TaxID=1990 RepID=UPI000364C47D|nr:MaoC/PaaZ C-terminal domain-containing protein [Actinomadura atramentaria]
MPDRTPPLPGDTHFVSDWFTIDEEHLRQFSWATYLDDAHVDLTPSRNHPLGSTLVDGFLLLSLLTYFSFKYAPRAGDGGYGFNYGTDRVRFTSPVMLGERVRVESVVVSAVERSGGTLLTTDNTMYVEGREKPAMVARWVVLQRGTGDAS